MVAVILASLLVVAGATASTPTVTCTVVDDPGGRVYRLRRTKQTWSLGLRHKELGNRWLELKLPGAEPTCQAGIPLLTYRNANGGRQVDLTVGQNGSSLDVWVDHGLEVNIEPDLDPRIDHMNTEGRVRSLDCRVLRSDP